MLHKQLNTLKGVIVDMENDINRFQNTIKSLSKEYNM